MNVEENVFGNHSGQDIYQYTLKNQKGMIVKIMNFGVCITSIQVPGPDGLPVSVACGFDRFEDYLSEEYRSNSPYFGCTVGRYCSQIKDASFVLEGQKYELAANCGENNLHGGNVGFDKKIWDAQPFGSENEAGVTFTSSSPHMEEGFPGKVEARVRITLNNENEIEFDYHASTDLTTPLSMTNHTYFNLSGFRKDVNGHKVSVFAQKKLELDDTGAATGNLLNLENAPDDLRDGKNVGMTHKAMGTGFEHFFIFDGISASLRKVAEITDPESGRKLEVESTEPCMLFYTGMYTSDNLQRHGEEKYGKYRGLCCETHRYPNGPNIDGSPGSYTIAGEDFSSQTVFRFL